MSYRDGCYKDMTLNKISNGEVDRRIMTKEAKVPTISEIPNETVYLKKG